MLFALLLFAAASSATPPLDYAGDARALDKIIVANYAYEDHWPGGVLPDSPALAQERAAVHDRDSLLHYAEDRMASLADPHAITGSSFKDSWAMVPTYSDLWVELRGARYVIDSVRKGSPAAAAGVVAGDRLAAVNGIPTEAAVASFWGRLGLALTPERADYAALVLAAGRRDRPRDLTIAHGEAMRRLTLPNLYSKPVQLPPLTVSKDRTGRTVIRINNSLGDSSTIAAFAQAMSVLAPRTPLVLDITDTPSGGNTTVARGIMG